MWYSNRALKKSTRMPDTTSDSDNGKPDEEIAKRAPRADIAKVTENEAKDAKEQPKSANKRTSDSRESRIMRRTIRTVCQWWEDLKKPEVSNRLIAAATVVIAAASGLTWHEMRNGSTQTDGIIAADQRIATAMENTVGQANAAFKSTVDQFHLEQRAWVGPTAVIQPEFKETDSFSISTLIKNTGKTPAVNFRNKYTWMIILKKGTFQASYKDPQGVPSSSTIFPDGQLMLISVPTPLPKEYLNLVVSGKAVLYVYGELIYDDIFNQTHHTHFCTFYDQSFKPGTCSTYNDVD